MWQRENIAILVAQYKTFLLSLEAAPLVVLRIVTVFLKVCSGFVPCNIVELLQGSAEVEWRVG